MSYLALTKLNCASATHDGSLISFFQLLTQTADSLGHTDVSLLRAPLLDLSFSIHLGSFQRPGPLCFWARSDMMCGQCLYYLHQAIRKEQCRALWRDSRPVVSSHGSMPRSVPQ